jgi:histidine phosphotransfer protein HptB
MSPLDIAYLSELSDGDPDFEKELLEVFLEDIPIHITAIQHAITTQDWPQLHRAAHQIKGASANIGANTLATFAHNLEQATEPQTALVLLLQLEQAFTDVEAWVLAYYFEQRIS